QVAEALGVSVRTVSRWEMGQAIPHPYYAEQLCTLFGKTAQEFNLFSDADENDAAGTSTQASFLADPAIPETLESLGHLLGRQGLLTLAKRRLFEGDRLALMALGGLQGIGTTTLAV